MKQGRMLRYLINLIVSYKYCCICCCRLRMRNNVVIKQLSVSVSASDQSYMPQVITVSVGKNCHSLREIKEVRIPRWELGQLLILLVFQNIILHNWYLIIYKLIESKYLIHCRIYILIFCIMMLNDSYWNYQ